MALPPAQPAYILRGHSSQIHSTAFIRGNSRLVTGDADGWIVLWSLATKRPTAVWRAHEGSILGVGAWGKEKLITHGKDNKLIVWLLPPSDEKPLSTILPVDTPPIARPQPWLLHVLNVNTMNFCSFASCSILSSPEELLIAVPNTLTSETVDIFHLPSSNRIHTLPASKVFKGGMIMALSISHHPTTGLLTVIAGYESGHTTVSYLLQSANPIWTTSYLSKPHTQPILSLSLSPSQEFYLTSSADANLAKHLIPSPSSTSTPNNKNPIKEEKAEKLLNTKHAGQQDLKIRNDGRIFVTAGWDGRVRVYDTAKMREVAVLKWHNEGVYAVSFADVEVGSKSPNQDQSQNQSGEASQNEVEKTEEQKEERKTLIKSSVAGRGLREERARKAEKIHWIAAGSKDGKVSLWDIY